MDGGLFIFLVICILFALIIRIYIRSTSVYQILKRNGIKGPIPSFFFGNYLERMKCGSHVEFVKKLHHLYGPIAGSYLGRQPQISVVDLDLIKLVTVTDFDNFVDRIKFPDVVRFPDGLLTVRGDRWKTERRVLTPTFAPLKMKAMAPLIQRSVKSLVEVFQQASKERSTEMHKLYGAFTMEAILATAFGRVIEVQKGESNELTKAITAVFSATEDGKVTSMSFMIMFLSNIPWLECVIKQFTRKISYQKSLDVLANAATAVVRKRKEEKGKYHDLLQRMIDTSVNGSEDGLTEEQIVGNAATFFVGGYETTAKTLSFASYLLALHPDIQERLQQEIDSYYEKNPDVSPYEAAMNIEYLDMFFHETLRVYPTVPIMSRHCCEDYKFMDITIPKGCAVNIPITLLHMNPEYWPNPEVFDPLRFTAEEKLKRPKLSYMPFGNGPRNCIGARLAHLEVKMALIGLLKRFSFARAPDTEVPLKLAVSFTLVARNGVFLKILPRNKPSEVAHEP